MTAPQIDTTRFDAVMAGIAAASTDLSAAIRHGRLPARDHADAIFREALKDAGLRWYAAAGADPVRMQADGDLAISIDALDGAGDLDTNAPVGTIFGIWQAEPTAKASFLRPARDLLAAGYVVHGARCLMVVTFGNGTLVRSLDHADAAFDTAMLPECAAEFAIDAAAYRHWQRPIRAYIDDCLAGSEGPRAQNFNMRWTGALVAQAHRILTRGGIALWPADVRPGQARGRLGMLHHCTPIALLIEQAGGRASDGALPILDATITGFHDLMPLIFGSADKVNRIAAYHDLPEAEVSALFGHRGLFRA